MSFKISDKIIGFENELAFFLKLYDNKCLPSTILFQGLEGIGKYSFVLHLINSIKSKSNIASLDSMITNDNNVLLLNKNDCNREYKFEEIKKVTEFCKYKSFDTKPRFVVIKSINFLNNSSINALLKLTEDVKENIYFFFTSNFLSNNSKVLESRFFKKKLFLNKKFYNQIIFNFFKNNNIDNIKIDENINDTPGIFIRKYFHNLNYDLESLKKNNENLFYKIISEKVIKKLKNNHIQVLKKIKLNLFLKNDISKILTKYTNE
tara:strand:- start:6304 stop:7092 length:789 start_codon:yes stop_codon:yes gene_type:complete